MSRVTAPSDCGKFNVTHLEEEQKRFVDAFSQLAVFKKFKEMDQQELTSVLIENYHYSKSYRALIDSAKDGFATPAISAAIRRIAQFENDPYCHVQLHKHSLQALGIGEARLSGEPSAETKQFVDYIQDILHRLANEDEENVFLSTLELRLATEVLPESQYLALVPAIEQILPYEDGEMALKFYTLHAEMDGENDGLEDVNASGHAGVFNSIVNQLYNTLYMTNNSEQNKALWQKCQETFQQAFEERKTFVEQF